VLGELATIDDVETWWDTAGAVPSLVSIGDASVVNVGVNTLEAQSAALEATSPRTGLHGTRESLRATSVAEQPGAPCQGFLARSPETSADRYDPRRRASSGRRRGRDDNLLWVPYSGRGDNVGRPCVGVRRGSGHAYGPRGGQQAWPRFNKWPGSIQPALLRRSVLCKEGDSGNRP
jgi:hypothetical protein